LAPDDKRRRRRRPMLEHAQNHRVLGVVGEDGSHR
jgi:hypothetical protein